MRPFMPLIMPLTAHSAARFCVGVSALTLLGISPVAAAAQSLQAVGTISGGNAVALETRTVKRTTNEVTATLRTTFLEPAKA
ncbi:MAG: hypothetical protein ACOVSI_05245, partial [Gemmatimonas sp.]